MGSKEIHFAEVTRNTDVEESVGLRGAVYFKSDTLTGGTEFSEPAEPCFPLATGKGGFFFVPFPGDIVEIEIDTAVEHPEPRWRCGVYSVEDEIDIEFQENYPYRMGWVSHSKHVFVFDDLPGSELIKLQHTIGTQFEMLANGDWLNLIYRNDEKDIRGDKKVTIRRGLFEEIFGQKSSRVHKDDDYIVDGESRSERKNNYEEIVGNTHTYKVTNLVEQIGTMVQNIQGAKDVVCDGGLKENIGGSRTVNVVSNNTETITGTDSRLVAATADETVGLGFKRTVVLGNNEYELVAGNFNVNILVGNFDFTTLGGETNIGNLLGGFATNLLGQVTVSGPGGELLDLVDQLIDTVDETLSNIQAITVPTAVGPSGPPVNTPAFIASQITLALIKVTLGLIKG